MGSKNNPFYRIIAIDSRNRRDGAYLENLGTYDPKKEPPEVKMNIERIDYWLEKGAKPSETVSSLIKKYRAKELDNDFAY